MCQMYSPASRMRQKKVQWASRIPTEASAQSGVRGPLRGITRGLVGDVCSTIGLRGKSLLVRGFTLIEMLVVVAIISILISLLMPAIEASLDYAEELSCLNNMKQVGSAAQMYYTDCRGWAEPDPALTLGAWGAYWRDVNGYGSGALPHILLNKDPNPNGGGVGPYYGYLSKGSDCCQNFNDRCTVLGGTGYFATGVNYTRTNRVYWWGARRINASDPLRTDISNAGQKAFYLKRGSCTTDMTTAFKKSSEYYYLNCVGATPAYIPTDYLATIPHQKSRKTNRLYLDGHAKGNIVWPN